MKHHAILLLVVLLTTACTKQALSVNEAYVRAPVADRDVTAAFMTIVNNSETANALQSASSPAAEKVELHQHTHSDGMMRMREVDSIDIAPQASVTLEPGGYHMMLIGIKPALREQENVELKLNFANDESITVAASVRSVLAD